MRTSDTVEAHAGAFGLGMAPGAFGLGMAPAIRLIVSAGMVRERGPYLSAWQTW